MKLYVSGPMTGFVEHNVPAFHKAAQDLRTWGHEVVSPGEFPQNSAAAVPGVVGDDTPSERAVYLRKDVFELSQCDGIVMLRGWELSTGANVELLVAQLLNLATFDEDDWPFHSELEVQWDLVHAHMGSIYWEDDGSLFTNDKGGDRIG